jgi:serine protease Do
MKPPAADGDFLGPGFERIGEQWPDRHIASSEGTDPVSRAAIIGHLLIKIAADASGEAIGEVLIERPLEMEFVAALVIGRGVDQIERHAERGGDLGPGLNQIRKRSGIDFENTNKIAAISFNFFPKGDLRVTYSRLLNVAGVQPRYSKIKDNFFAIVTEGGGSNTYSRYQAIPGGIIGFTLSWTQDDAQNAVLHGERLATLMSDLFRSNIELGLPRSPPAPRLMVAAVPHVPLPATPLSPPAVPEGSKPEDKSSLGTGFFVSSEGHIITNSHVVKDCSSVQVTLGLAPKMAGRIMEHDTANDLALIKVETHPTAFASLRSGVRLGEGVAAFGFPLAGLLATSGNFTLGNVTAVAGLGDDTRILQISASVQPGNSGGPLLDYSGKVVGVVEGKLNAIAVATVINDLAQNVNFAIKANVVTNFLDANSVAYTSGVRGSNALQPSEIAERAKSLAVMIECNK